VQRALLLDLVVGEGAAVLELLFFCRVCHHNKKRHRVLTRCSNVSICKNAHVCIHHFVEFHNSALHLEAASDGDDDA
jgi:hypothetical protein